MANTYVNKVQLADGTSLIDISDSTVTADKILQGYTAYGANGAKLTGTATGGGTAAISVVDTTDSHGGTIREITALDISDTTAVASDVASGKYFYTAAGVKTAGTASGGSGSSGTQVSTTGTFTGNGTNSIQISCAFEPREIYIRGDLTGDVTLRGIVSFTLIKDKILVSSNDSSTSNTSVNVWFLEEITGFNEANSASAPYATYSNGTLTIDTVVNSSGARWPSGITYSYTLIGFATPIEHIIHLEFGDSSETDISLNYDNSLIGTMITNYTPNTWTYSNKTVMLAELDGTAWYDKTTIPIGVQLIDYSKVKNGYVVDSGTGEEIESTWNSVSDYTAIEPNMIFSYLAYEWFSMVFYDASKEYISSIYMHDDADSIANNYAQGTLTPSKIPATAKYVRIPTNPSNPTSAQLSLIRTA